MGLNRSNIDYLKKAKDLIGRTGYSFNPISGCLHNCPYCYARVLVVGRFKWRYSNGFTPTFLPYKLRAFGGCPKLIFLGTMGDVGGDWEWRIKGLKREYGLLPPERLSSLILQFALLNPKHIILLCTKNPAWYRFQEWPENVKCGFTAINNQELADRWLALQQAGIKREQSWASLEPWLDSFPPISLIALNVEWAVLGGLSGKGGKGVSRKTLDWIDNFWGVDCDLKLFVKKNAKSPEPLEEYPQSWRV